jgi:hypothetical protein
MPLAHYAGGSLRHREVNQFAKATHQGSSRRDPSLLCLGLTLLSVHPIGYRQTKTQVHGAQHHPEPQGTEWPSWYLLMKWSQGLWSSCHCHLLGRCAGTGRRGACSQCHLSQGASRSPPGGLGVLPCICHHSHMVVRTQDKEGPFKGTEVVIQGDQTRQL